MSKVAEGVSMMAETHVTREQVEEMVAAAEAQCPQYLIEDYTWILDCGESMGKPRTWVEVAPGLQVLVHPWKTHYVLLFYPRAKRWLDPGWKPTMYGS